MSEPTKEEELEKEKRLKEWLDSQPAAKKRKRDKHKKRRSS